MLPLALAQKFIDSSVDYMHPLYGYKITVYPHTGILTTPTY